MAGRVGLLPVEQAVETERLSPGGGGVKSGGDELDPPGHEALDIENVETLVEPGDKEVGEVDAMGSDGPRLPFFDRGRIHGQGESAEGDLGERLLKGRALATYPSATRHVEVGEAGAQDRPPPRSP